MKKCTKCNKIKNFNGFYKNKKTPDGLRTNCKICHNKVRDKWANKNKKRLDQWRKEYRNKSEVKEKRCGYQKKWRSKNLDWDLWHKAKIRSKKLGLAFNLEKSDIIIPKYCPVLNIKLEITEKTIGDNSATIDRINPEIGYVKGNIIVMSAKANRMKNNASVDEIKKLYLWSRRHM